MNTETKLVALEKRAAALRIGSPADPTFIFGGYECTYWDKADIRPFLDELAEPKPRGGNSTSILHVGCPYGDYPISWDEGKVDSYCIAKRCPHYHGEEDEPYELMPPLDQPGDVQVLDALE